MKKLNLYDLIYLSIFILAIVVLIVTPISKEHTKIKQNVIIKYKKIYIKRIDKDKFIRWIYNNSFRCSLKQADYIAGILIKTKYPLLFAAIIKNESNFNITAYNRLGAIGLMQILPTKSHIKQLKEAGIINNVRDLFNPYNNIMAGQFIFNDILKINKGSLRKALLMYCGNSKNYVSKVLQSLGELTIYVRNAGIE